MSSKTPVPTTIEELRKDKDLRNKIQAILDKKYIKTGPIADIIASAIFSGQHVILHGPGGHGKSEMVEDILEGLGLYCRDDLKKSSTLIQSFGEGLTEQAIWGGISFKALNDPDNPEMIYHVENSFLNYEVAVFEEMFDAPAFCLLALKHTIQSKMLAKEGRVYPMKTKLIIACTNQDPNDLASRGAQYSALMERFVLQQYVAWEKYDTDSYAQMLQKHPIITSGEMTMAPHLIKLYASLLQDIYNSGTLISPRTAMKGLEIMAGHARSRQTTSINQLDFPALGNVPGFSGQVRKFQEQIERKLAEQVSQEKLATASKELESLVEEFDRGTNKVISWALMARRFKDLSERLGNLDVLDSMFNMRNEMRKSAQSRVQTCLDKLLDCVQVG